MALNHEEKEQLLKQVAAFEASTGIELVTAIRPRCDDYPEIPWKAFALGIAAGALAVLLALLFPEHPWRSLIPGPAGSWGNEAGGRMLMAVLGAGLISAGLATWVPAYARLFLSVVRAESEAQQVAQSLFLEHELFRTGTRTGILMLITAFEHRVVLLADHGLRTRLPSGALDEVVTAMTPALRVRAWTDAFSAGMARLETIVQACGFTGGSRDNTLPDHLDADRGEGDSC